MFVRHEKGGVGVEEDTSTRESWCRQSGASDGLFPPTDVSVVVHGDDFVFAGPVVELSKGTSEDTRMLWCQGARAPSEVHAAITKKLRFWVERSARRMTDWSTRQTRHTSKRC